MENLSDYFDSNSNVGILATAEHLGKVNAATYTRPYFLDEIMALFIMEELTHANLGNNPNAAYLSIESFGGWWLQRKTSIPYQAEGGAQ